MADEPLTADSIVVRVISGDITPAQLEGGADEAFAEAQRALADYREAVDSCEKARAAHAAALAFAEMEKARSEAAWATYQEWKQARKRLAEAGRRAAGAAGKN